jgi:K+-transporting ATPase ATPase A chain
MAAQAFLLIASFLSGVVRSGKATGIGLARLINNVPCPAREALKRDLARTGNDDREMNWRQYLIAILLLNIVGLIALLPC